jgi:hypothetical protein
MHATAASQIIWILGLCLEIVVAGTILAKRYSKEAPLFLAYIAFQVIREIAGFISFYSSYKIYFYQYWVGDAIVVVLGLCVIFELYRNAFRRYNAIKRLAESLFLWATAILILLALLTAISTSGNESSKLMAGILLFERSARIVEFGLLLVLFFLTSFFGLRWQQYMFGIAFGYGLYACLNLIVTAERFEVGGMANRILSLIGPLSYLTALAVWTVYFILPEPAQLTEKLPKQQLNEWNRALLELLHP